MKRANGTGSIQKCKGRRKPWKATSPAMYNVDVLTPSGDIACRRMVIGYFSTRKEAELALAKFCISPCDVSDTSTFADVFRLWIDKKVRSGKSKATITSYNAAFRRCGSVSKKAVRSITLDDLLEIFRQNSDGGRSTVNNIKIVIDGVFEYAERHELICKNYARLIDSDDIYYTIPTEDKHRTFTAAELGAVFSAPSDIYNDCTVILLYTGFRISELLTMTKDNICLDEQYFQGGLKTKAGRNRIVPIHPDIMPIVKKHFSSCISGKVFPIKDDQLRTAMQERFDHKPHDTRHTFITRLKAVGADNVCIERLVGHASKSITDSVYTHKDMDELRRCILMLDYSQFRSLAVSN